MGNEKEHVKIQEKSIRNQGNKHFEWIKKKKYWEKADAVPDKSRKKYTIRTNK